MSEFFEPDVELTFMNLTSSLETELPDVPAFSNLPVAAWDNVRVALDRIEGEEVREDLLEAYAAVKSVVPATAESPLPAQKFFVAALNEAFTETLMTQRKGRGISELHAVRGTTLFEVPQDDDPLPTHNCLLPEETMYGRFSGATPRVFPIVTGKRLLESLSTGVNLNPKPMIIGAICLEAVEICRDNSGWGQVDRRFAEVLVPITNRDIQFFRGYPLE